MELDDAVLGGKKWGFDVAIFLGPEGEEIPDLLGVDFELDDEFVRTERYVDYDLFGTRRNGSAVMVPLLFIGWGEHTVSATVRVAGQQPCTVEATFRVAKPRWASWFKWHWWTHLAG